MNTPEEQRQPTSSSKGQQMLDRIRNEMVGISDDERKELDRQLREFLAPLPTAAPPSQEVEETKTFMQLANEFAECLNRAAFDPGLYTPREEESLGEWIVRAQKKSCQYVIDEIRKKDAFAASQQKEREELMRRIAAINGQKNVMENNLAGFKPPFDQPTVDRFWNASKLMGELIAGDYDHNLAQAFDLWKAAEATASSQAKEIESKANYIASIREEVTRAGVPRSRLLDTAVFELVQERDRLRKSLQTIHTLATLNDVKPSEIEQVASDALGGCGDVTENAT